jgi:hypothetical protein
MDSTRGLFTSFEICKYGIRIGRNNIIGLLGSLDIAFGICSILCNIVECLKTTLCNSSLCISKVGSSYYTICFLNWYE